MRTFDAGRQNRRARICRCHGMERARSGDLERDDMDALVKTRPCGWMTFHKDWSSCNSPAFATTATSAQRYHAKRVIHQSARGHATVTPTQTVKSCASSVAKNYAQSNDNTRIRAYLHSRPHHDQTGQMNHTARRKNQPRHDYRHPAY